MHENVWVIRIILGPQYREQLRAEGVERLQANAGLVKVKKLEKVEIQLTAK